ncbi:uncharacterized protein C15orf61-like [Aphomia sociella]
MVQFSSKPTSSEVLTAYLMQCNEPSWTSYFVKVISKSLLDHSIPCLLYGLAATQLIKHKETVNTNKEPVTIYFLLPEHKGSQY